MKSLIFAAMAGLVLPVFSASSAEAQASRTFVSGHGADSGPCGLSTPCRSFTYAMTQTGAGGEISVLDPAGYGALTIDKAISIVNDGVGEAAVTATASGDIALSVSAGASDVVNLRGLTIVGNGTADYGIVWYSGASLNIQNCAVRGFAKDGLLYNHNANSNLSILDSIFSGQAQNGIHIAGSSTGSETIYFKNVRTIYNQQNGILIDQGTMSAPVQGVIETSSISQNQQNGVQIAEFASTQGTIDFIGGTISSNGSDGVFFGISNNLAFTLAGMTVAENKGFGVNNKPSSFPQGVVYTFGNNNFSNNTSGSVSGTLTPKAQQ